MKFDKKERRVKRNNQKTLDKKKKVSIRECGESINRQVRLEVGFFRIIVGLVGVGLEWTDGAAV